MLLSSLTAEEQVRVNNIIKGKQIIKIKYVHKSFTKRERQYLSEVFSNYDNLTVAETCIWLDKCSATVYKYIKKGLIVAIKPLEGRNSPLKVDVKLTKKNFNI